MLNKLFLDAWGTAFVECGSTWIKNNIANDLEAKGLYLTNSFSPGQNNIPMEIQEIVFQLLSPEEIHVTLSDKFMMHPKKSISSILGIQYCKDVYNICACDLCVRKDTCPNAYS
jgi:hypothetical protein